MNKRFFVTGEPGVGKTTLVLRVAERLATRYKVGGFYTPEVRWKNTRIGFKVVEIGGKREAWLAKVGEQKGAKFGRYTLVLEGALLAKEALERAVSECDLVVIDEIGPMELAFQELKRAIELVLKSEKRVLGVVHRSLAHEFPSVFFLTKQNREQALRVALESLGECF
jgi:nucleoside-triphosphatase